jgi:hypothetical protein
VKIWALDLGGGGGEERFLSLAYKICKKNKEDWTSVDKRLKRFIKKSSISGGFLIPH